MTRAIFMDRDGVIGIEKNLFYKGSPVLSLQDFEWEKGAKEAVGELSSLKDFKFFIVTNQSAIGKGLLNEEEFHRTNNLIHEEFDRNKIQLATYFCPHLAQERCQCRKPLIGMLLQAKEEHGIDLTKSYFIGDKTSDIQVGKNARCKTILVETGYAGRDELYQIEPDYTTGNLLTAIKLIKKLEKNE